MINKERVRHFEMRPKSHHIIFLVNSALFMSAMIFRLPFCQGAFVPRHTFSQAKSAFISSHSHPENHVMHCRKMCITWLSLSTVPSSGHHGEEAATQRRRANSHSFPPIVHQRIKDLEQHPAVVWDESSTFASMHKKKLARRHLPLFDRSNLQINDDSLSNFSCDSLFDKFAQAVCHAGVVARKEVFETWAAALYIHSSFLAEATVNESKMKSIRRVADIAAGHGLLAWALLVLDDEHQLRKLDNSNGCTTDVESPPLTAFCLDVQMPPSAELIQSSMIEQWPHLEKRFDYVEGRLEQLVPHVSCLLASVHACGGLSDVLVATAADHSIPLAVVPCCHSRKRKVLEAVASPFAKNEYDAILNEKGSMPDFADRLDEARMVAMENAGFHVDEVFIPDLFTGKNRLILGFPMVTQKPAMTIATQEKKEVSIPTRNMPPLDSFPMVNPKARFMKGFYVPCEDNEANRSIITDISGRAAANNRKVVMHNRNHTDAPQFDLSLWLPPQSNLETDSLDRVLLSEQALSRLVQSHHPDVECVVSKFGSVYEHPQTGRSAQTFRIQYKGLILTKMEASPLSFDNAKRIHKRLYDMIPSAFPGAECR